MANKQTTEVFDLDAVETDVEYPPFEFKRGRKRYQLPNLFTMTPDQMDRLDSKDTGIESIQGVFREVGAGPAADLLNGLEAARSFALMKAWREFSMSTMQAAMNIDDDDDGEGGEGKGSASSTSSAPNRAARRSKPTSRSGASTSGRSRSGSPKRS